MAIDYIYFLKYVIFKPNVNSKWMNKNLKMLLVKVNEISWLLCKNIEKWSIGLSIS